MTALGTKPERRIGVEIEFAGLEVEDVARLTAAVFRGSVRENHPLEYFVDSDFGKFRVELDSKPLKDWSEQVAKRTQSGSFTLAKLGFDAIRSAASTLVPCEIATPPLPEPQLQTLDELVSRLHKLGASGTRDGLLYAFGVHFNPELLELRAAIIHEHLQSFFLLRPWIKDAFDTDLSRQATPYIQPHGDDYVALVMGQDAPSIEQLIDQYVKYNPSRNRDLDMLPMLTHLDEERVRRVINPEEKVNNRPTFHYRLPNADVGNPHWTVTGEWKSWQAVERLAQSTSTLARGVKEWNHRYGASKAVDAQSWIPFVEEQLL